MIINSILRQYVFVCFLLIYFLYQLLDKYFNLSIFIKEKQRAIVYALSGLLLAMVLVSFGVSFIPDLSQTNSVSILFAKGHPMYHSLKESFFYNSFYGPIYYLIYALPVMISHAYPGVSVLSSYISPLAFLLDLVLLSVILIRLNREKNYAVSATNIVFMVCFYAIIIFNVGGFPIAGCEPITSVLVLISLYLALNRGRNWNLFIQPVLMALFMNIKVHGFIYFLPSLWMLLDRKTFRYRDYLLMVPVFIGVFSLPFRLGGIDFYQYLDLLSRLKYWPNYFPGVLESLNVVVLLIAPFLLTDFRRGVIKNNYLLVLLASTFLVFPFLAKHGAGQHHLAPLMPNYIILYFYSFSDFGVASRRNQLWAIGLVGLTLCFGLYRNALQGYAYFNSARTVSAKLQEMNQIADKYPNDTLVYMMSDYLYHRPERPYSFLLYLKNQPVYLDNEFLGNYVKATKTFPLHLVEPLKSRVYDKIIFDRGVAPFNYDSALFRSHPVYNKPQDYYKIFVENFKVRNHIELPVDSLAFKFLILQKWINLDYETFLYQKSNMFPSSFSDTFKQQYTLFEQTGNFDIYQRNSRE